MRGWRPGQRGHRDDMITEPTRCGQAGNGVCEADRGPPQRLGTGQVTVSAGLDQPRQLLGTPTVPFRPR